MTTTDAEVDVLRDVDLGSKAICQVIADGVACEREAAWRCISTCPKCPKPNQLNICAGHKFFVELIAPGALSRCGVHRDQIVTVEWRPL